MYLTFGKNNPVPVPVLVTINGVLQVDTQQMLTYVHSLKFYFGENHLQRGFQDRFNAKYPQRFFTYAGGSYATLVNFCEPVQNDDFDK